MIPYCDFRSGLTFADVRAELQAEKDSQYQAGQYRFITRRTVLGRWRQHKLSAYTHYLRSLEPDTERD